jgi:hypothetical protein
MQRARSSLLRRTVTSLGTGLAAGALSQSLNGTTEGPAPIQPLTSTPSSEDASSPAPSATPAPADPTDAMPRAVYQNEQFAGNSAGVPFMNFGMWNTGRRMAPGMNRRLLRASTETFAAPSNEDAPRNRMLAGGAAALAGGVMQLGPLPIRILGTALTAAGGAQIGGEAVARRQAARTPIIPDPEMTRDPEQIERDFATYRQQLGDSGYRAQEAVVDTLDPVQENANVSAVIQPRLLPTAPRLWRRQTQSTPSTSTPSSADNEVALPVEREVV